MDVDVTPALGAFEIHDVPSPHTPPPEQTSAESATPKVDTESVSGMVAQGHVDLPVARIAVATAERASALRRRASACAAAIASPAWAPEPRATSIPLQVLSWEQLPSEGGFKRQTIKEAGKKRRCSIKDKEEQVQEYQAWQGWLLEHCGTTDEQFRDRLAVSSGIARQCRGTD